MMQILFPFLIQCPVEGSQCPVEQPHKCDKTRFEEAIKNGHIESLQSMIDKGVAVNYALPSGEFPLHLAVRSGQIEAVKILMGAGADPEIKDTQQLSALDHAIVMRKEEMVVVIVGAKIGREANAVMRQLSQSGSTEHVQCLAQKVKNIAAVDSKKLPPFHKAAYEGKIKDLEKNCPPAMVNIPDSNGLRPIHYAILGKQLDVLGQLVNWGADLSVTTDQGDSLFHFAAASQSLAIFKRLLTYRAVKRNLQNSEGETALHYIAATENMHLMAKFIQYGFEPTLVDKRGMSPLAVIGKSALQRDPLALSYPQIFMFAATSLYWFSQATLLSGWALSAPVMTTLAILQFAAVVAADSCQMDFLVHNLDGNWQQLIAWVGAWGIRSIPQINVGLQAWCAYHVARTTFHSLRACWDNMGYRNWRIARNAVVHTANASYSLASLWRAIGTFGSSQESIEVAASTSQHVSEFLHNRCWSLNPQSSLPQVFICTI